MKIVITTLNNLPEYCWNCPCCSSVGRCRADEERRKTSEYRPFWCPLREEKEEQATPEESVHPALIYSVPLHLEELITVNVEEKVHVSKCDRCGKTIKRDSLITINDNLHVCKDCDQWFTEHLTKSEREQLYTEVEEKIRVAHCDRCGKIVESNSLTTVVKIKHGGTSNVNYPHDGKFVICKNCERWLLKHLAYNKEEEEK